MLISYFTEKIYPHPGNKGLISQFHYELLEQAVNVAETCSCATCAETAQNYMTLAAELKTDNEQFETACCNQVVLFSQTCFKHSDSFTLWRKKLKVRMEAIWVINPLKKTSPLRQNSISQ